MGCSSQHRFEERSTAPQHHETLAVGRRTSDRNERACVRAEVVARAVTALSMPG